MQDIPTSWLILGLVGQGLFSMRFLIQWIYSEKHKKSIIPHAFWYFSLAGGVFIIGQGMGLFVYIRNLILIRREQVSDI